MPILPLDHSEPFAATLGTMLYPGTDETERRKAGTYTSGYLAGPIGEYVRRGGQLSAGQLQQIIVDGGERIDDLDDRWLQGELAGHILRILFLLYHEDAQRTSWNSATAIVARIASQNRIRASRSTLYKYRDRFMTVAHLWAAWVMRGHSLGQDLPDNIDAATDFQIFLAEAETIRNWGQEFVPAYKGAKPFLPDEVWQPPEWWKPPEAATWPRPVGSVLVNKLSEKDLQLVKPAGRPRRP